MKEVGLCGFGYWGSNLARCFNQLEALKVIYDFNMAPRDRARVAYPHVEVRPTYEGIDFSGIDAVAVATPPETHFHIAKQFLEGGKDVFIEKPMTTSYNDAILLVETAKELGRNLMVGHIYLSNGGIKSMPIPVGRAELYVQLLNEKGGPSPSTRDVLWAALPHACSLALHFFPDMPEWIEAKREGERIKATLTYWNGSVVYLDVGDFTGRKLRRVELRDGLRALRFDVANPNVHLTSAPRGWIQEEGSDEEPLLTECKAFLEYKGVDPMGPKVVKLIEDIRICLK